MLERIIEIAEETLNLDGSMINEDTSLKEDLGVDSLDLFELVMALEEEYGLEIPTEDLEKLSTVGSLIEYLRKNGADA